MSNNENGKQAVNPPKSERIEEFLRRVAAAPLSVDGKEAFQQLSDVLNSVEDDMTTIPFDPVNWMTDGRMNPPQMDHLKSGPRSKRRKTISNSPPQHFDRGLRGNRDS